MTKTDLQKQFEDEQDREAVAEFSYGKIYLPAYGEWCERKVLNLMEKVAAYDRLMSGGKKTIQEYIAKYWDKQVIDFAVRLDGEDSFYIHPALESGDTLNFKAHGNCLETIWGYTLPDGWEEK